MLLIELVGIYEYCRAYGWQSLDHFQCHKVSIINEIIKAVTKNVNFFNSTSKSLEDAERRY